jgi:hypothetical protein
MCFKTKNRMFIIVNGGYFMPKFIEFELDKVRKFRMNMSSIARIEKRFGCAFAKIEHTNLKVEDFAYLLWATLEQKDREEIKDYIDLLNIIDEYINIKEVYALFTEIMQEAFGKNEQTPEIQNDEEIPEEEETQDGENLYPTL